MVKAVLFDWGGTLTPWHTVDAKELWRTIATESAISAAAESEPVPTIEQLVDALLAAEDAAWARSRDEHTSTSMADVCAAAGIALTAELLAAHERHWEPHTYTDPDAVTVLAELRNRGLRVGLLSNTVWSREHHERILRRDGVLDLFDGAVYTSEIPWTKPHPEAFRAAMDAVGVDDPSACVYVGDRLFDDIYGAQAAGMRAVHVPHSAVPPQQVGHTVGEPDAVIQRLTDLVPVVDRWRA
ncbi:HAD family hydrolase [Cryptosporangium aurantiacum]|uniref:Putative hydrolase of the HAD superfamily n=1 Tax=Cryptosporangium aurantiacum TaxID=134849 RepID=A0A1M7IP04_9ACTN|nr:HAD family hydrolase [Cryptosporangium aurantiacum]SHM42318.1 putative hydrolase of the HAD superfamily [Cryptosporangium aurantiacum]